MAIEVEYKLNLISYYEALNNEVVPYEIAPHEVIVELITGGVVFFELDGKMQKFGKGGIFWHIAGEKTVHLTSDDALYKCCVFRFDVSDDIRIVPRVSSWENIAALDDFVRETRSTFHENKLALSVLSDYCFNTLRYHALRYIAHKDAKPLPEILLKALEYLADNYNRNIALDELCSHCGRSRPYLFGIFKQYLNRTPYRCLTDLRLSHAKTLLGGNNYSIKEICGMCGFENIEVFYRSFKKSTTLTPRQYRDKFKPY